MTTSSLASRVIGFFLRIYISRTFGNEQIGLYQLIFPIYALCFSITSAGIELALSRCVAKANSLGQKNRAFFLLYISLFLSVLLSCLIILTLSQNASEISIHILGDLRCEPLLVTLSYTLPFASIHSCICGYYLGTHYANVFAYSQLIEQLCRVISIMVLCHLFSSNILFAVYGIIMSEIISAVFCIIYFLQNGGFETTKFPFLQIPSLIKELLSLATPLTLNRLLTNLLQSIESISIPLSLQKYGYTNTDALSAFGILTGMALPCVLFPSAITNSLATFLLPTVTELQTKQNRLQLRQIIQKTFSLCVILGMGSCFLFFIFSNFIGTKIFHNSEITKYLKVLCWICPFLYTNTTLSSIINGLGKTRTTFFFNSFCIFFRILSIIVFVPRIGINGYLWGLLLSQLCSFFLQFFYLFHQLKRTP